MCKPPHVLPEPGQSFHSVASYVCVCVVKTLFRGHYEMYTVVMVTVPFPTFRTWY